MSPRTNTFSGAAASRCAAVPGLGAKRGGVRGFSAGACVWLLLASSGFAIAEPTAANGAPRWELEVGQLWQDLAAERPLSVTAYELGVTAPAWGGEFNAELEGGQRSDGDRAARTPDFVFNLNQMVEASAFKVGRIVWRRTWASRWHTTLGRFAPESFLDKVTYASSKTTRFLARPFVRPTAVADPGTSVGLLARRDFGRARLILLTNDANGTGHLSPAHTLKGEWFHAAEFQLPRGERGRLRLLPWATRRGGRSARGWSFSHEEALAPEFGWFVRGGVEKGGLARTSRLLAAGVSWEPTKTDRLAAAFARGTAPGGARREALMEAYLSHAFSPEFSVSLHGQQSRRHIRTSTTEARETVFTLRVLWAGEIRGRKNHGGNLTPLSAPRAR